MKFNLNKKVLTVTALFGLAVGVIVYFVAHAATVLCAAGAVAPCGAAPLGTTVNADTIIAAAGGSTIIPQAGNDIIYGSNANDTVPCAGAADCLGDDFMDLRGGADVVGGALCANQANVLGNDFIIGGPESALDGADTLCGGPGNDYLFGGAGNDLLAGYADNDVIVPGTGVDAVCNNAALDAAPCNGVPGGAGGGDDVVIIYAGDVPAVAAPGEQLFCGTGNDVFIFVGFSALPALVVPVGGAVQVTDPITGGVYTITNTGATPCVLTN